MNFFKYNKINKNLLLIKVTLVRSLMINNKSSLLNKVNYIYSYKFIIKSLLKQIKMYNRRKIHK